MVKIWFQNRRTKWKRQDNVTNSEAAEVKSANHGKSTTSSATSTSSTTAITDNATGKATATANDSVTTTTSSANPEGMAVATTKKNSHNSPGSNSSNNNNSNNNVSSSNSNCSNIESKRNIANELSAKLTAKQATKIKKQLNAILEKTSKNAAGTKSEHSNTATKSGSGGTLNISTADKASINTKAMDGSSIAKEQTAPLAGASNATTHNNHRHQHHHTHHNHNHNHNHHHSHNHRHIPHHHHAIPLTVEPAAPLEQTEKLDIKLEESPQHRELQLTLLRAAHGQSPHFGEMDFESKLAASKISNALAMAKLNVGEINKSLTAKEKCHKKDENADANANAFSKDENLQKLSIFNIKQETKPTAIKCKEENNEVNDEQVEVEAAAEGKANCDSIKDKQRADDDKDHQMEFEDFIENKNVLAHNNETVDADNDAKMKEI